MSRISAEGEPSRTKWPIIESESIAIGDPNSNVAVATLWSKHRDIVEQLDPNSFAVAGQLYEKYGISYLLRNIAANPNIRHLIVCGADLSHSGEALVRLWQDGVDDDHQIIGIDKAPIQREIPREAIDILRRNVLVHDLRTVKQGELAPTLREFIGNLPRLPSWGEPLTFPNPEIKTAERLPSEPGVHTVNGKTIGEVWLKILREVMYFGEDAGTNYTDIARDLNNLVVVVTDEDPKNPKIEEFFNFTRGDVAAYILEFLSPKAPTEEGVYYKYGNRFRAFEIPGYSPIDQSKIIIEKLKKDPNDRGAVGILYDVLRDNQLDRDAKIDGFRTSCILSYQAYVREGKLELVAVFRSNDMYGAWPRNAFGLRFLQTYLATQLGYPLGPLVTISHRAHIYQKVWPQVDSILESYGSRLHKFEADPRGNLRITVDNSSRNITVVQQDESGVPLKPAIIGDGNRRKAAWSFGLELASQGIFSSTQHALDVGVELGKAELAAKLGVPYVQDSDELINDIVAKLKRLEELEKRGLTDQE